MRAGAPGFVGSLATLRAPGAGCCPGPPRHACHSAALSTPPRVTAHQMQMTDALTVRRMLVATVVSTSAVAPGAALGVTASAEPE